MHLVHCPKADARVWDDICETLEEADTLLKIDAIRLEHAAPFFYTVSWRKDSCCMSVNKIEQSLRNLEKAVLRLKQARDEP